MRSNPDQLGIVIHQTHSPAYAEAPEERWDRTYVTSPEGKSNDTRDQNNFQLTKAVIRMSRSKLLHSFKPWGTTQLAITEIVND